MINTVRDLVKVETWVISSLVLSVMVGALLGRFCHVLALLLACTLLLFRFACAEQSLVRSIFEYAVHTASLQISYFLGLFSEEQL
jgi:hypothetical protein